MKTITRTCSIWLTNFLALATWSMAEPLLVCDPYAEKPDGFAYVLDGGPEIKVPYQEKTTSGETVAVVMDMVDVPEGDHKITVMAYNAWGQSDPVPFVFARKLPGAPTSIRFRR